MSAYPCKHGVTRYCGLCEVVEPMLQGQHSLASATGSVAWWVVLRPSKNWKRGDWSKHPKPVAAFINEGLTKEWKASAAHRNHDITVPPNADISGRHGQKM